MFRFHEPQCERKKVAEEKRREAAEGETEAEDGESATSSCCFVDMVMLLPPKCYAVILDLEASFLSLAITNVRHSSYHSESLLPFGPVR